MAGYSKQKSSEELQNEFGIGPVAKGWREHDAFWLFRILKNESGLPRYLKNLIVLLRLEREKTI